MNRDNVVFASVLGRALACLAAAAIGCGDDGARASTASPAEPGISPRAAADMLHAVMEADRTVYTKMVVNRLTKEQQVEIVDPETKAPAPLAASEQWKSEHGTLPLPAQMFRMGSEHVAKQGSGLSYVLLSKWPVNKQNQARTAVEIEGLEQVAASPEKAPFYGTEELGGKRYFTAVYADVAVAPACVDCHNEHPDSPRRDFEVGDVMGGVVIRIPL